jgi:hypothetical protein
VVRSLVLFLVSVTLATAQLAPGRWATDLSKRSIELSELRSGGPPKDGIPAILNPRFVSGANAAKWLHPKEPVLVVEHDGEARAYPLQILIFHELVNDRIGDLPILVSYCPLCNSALTFDRRIDGRTYTFGVSGMLRNSDMIMYDHQTDSLWQQLTGDALVGTLTGKRLDLIAGQVVPYDRFQENYPEGKVLSRQTGHLRQYGASPYAGYEFANRTMFPVRVQRQANVRPMERMLTLTLGGKTRAYPFEQLRSRRVIDGRLKKQSYVIFYEPTALSPMDKRRIAESRSVGSVGVFSSEVDGRGLKFRFKDGLIRDKESGSTWNLFGKAVEGPMEGTQLEPIEHGVFYAFALLAFYPRAELIGVPDANLPALPSRQPGTLGQPAGASPDF